MSNHILTIGNVRGYVDENGIAYLNAEDVARGWGFVQKQNKNGKVYESIRWVTLNEYLEEFGFPQQVGEDDFLPENIVYRLGFKAKNEKAVSFQIKLSDEILPSIRKTGFYSINPQLPDFRNPVEAARAWADAEEGRLLAEKQVKQLTDELEEAKPKVLYCDTVFDSKEIVPVSVIAKDYGRTAIAMNELLKEQGIQYKLGNCWYISNKYAANNYIKYATTIKKDKKGEPFTITYMKWTNRGRIFIYNFLKDIGILPLIELANN